MELLSSGSHWHRRANLQAAPPEWLVASARPSESVLLQGALDAQAAKRPRALPDWWRLPSTADLELLEVAHRRGFYPGSRKHTAEALLGDPDASFEHVFQVRRASAGASFCPQQHPLMECVLHGVARSWTTLCVLLALSLMMGFTELVSLVHTEKDAAPNTPLCCWHACRRHGKVLLIIMCRQPHTCGRRLTVFDRRPAVVTLLMSRCRR